MKKTILGFLCLLPSLFLGAQTTSLTSTFASSHITAIVVDSMYHDSTACQCYSSLSYNITVDSSFAGDSLQIIDTVLSTLVASYVNTTGASPWNIVVSPSGFGSYYTGGTTSDVYTTARYVHFWCDPTKLTGTHDTLRYIILNDSLSVPNPCLYDTVSGRVYVDNNGNCVFDSGDGYLYSTEVDINETTSSPSAGWNWGISGGVTTYSLIAQRSWMVNYGVSIPSYYAFLFPSSPCFVDSLVFSTLPQTGVDFPLQCSSSIDLQCYAGSPGWVRPNKPFYMQPYVTNMGCDVVSGQMTLVKDPHAIYDPSLSTYPADIVSGDTLTWNYYNISNLSGAAYWNSFLSDIYLTPDSTLVVGDTLCFRIYTGIPATDINPANNDYSFCLPVVYSYDPNEKEVSPKGTGPEGYIPSGTDTLTYTLHFQNTGTSYAENIVVIDTLDSHINAASFRVLGNSAQMTPQWLAPHVVAFNFSGINLPDSGTNEAGSHGFVRFSAALNAGLAPATQIRNTGYIYFDTNPAVVTNTTLNTIAVTPALVNPLAALPPVTVYPNPATDHITVENLSGGSISILNVDGQVMLQQNISNNKTTVDVSGLPEGVYMLKAVSSTASVTKKFIKL